MAQVLQSGWGRATARSGRVRSQYANFWLPEQVTPATVIWQAQAAIGGRRGWHPDNPGHGAGDAVGYATWTHHTTRLQLLLILAGLRPLIVSVGQRRERPASEGRAGPSEVAAAGRTMRNDLAVVGQALKQIGAAYRTLGGPSGRRGSPGRSGAPGARAVRLDGGHRAPSRAARALSHAPPVPDVWDLVTPRGPLVPRLPL